jgi:hypothetical protein
MDVQMIGREEFLRDYWTYRAGEHVTFLGPTGSGKTLLTWQLLQYTATRDVPATVLATKPRDLTTAKWMKRLGWPKVTTWPPPPSVRRLLSRPAGRVLWPKHFNPGGSDADDLLHARVFGAALRGMYKAGNQIIDVDEVLDMVDLKLETEMRTLWTRGRSMGAGLWAGTQQPFHVPTHAYRQAEHLFVAKDPDKRSRDRFDEIGGLDSGQVKEWVIRLRKYEFLYLRRTGPEVCVIGK